LQPDNNRNAKNLVRFVDKLFDMNPYTKVEKGFIEELQSHVDKIPEFFKSPKGPKARIPPVKLVEIIPKFKPIVLSNEISQMNALKFTPTTSANVVEFKKICNEVFEADQASGNAKVEPFEYHGDDQGLEDSIKSLNEDYIAGANINYKVPRYKLKHGQSIQELLSTQRKLLSEAEIGCSKEILEQKENVIKGLANREPKDQKERIRFRSDIASGRKQALEIDDCVGLFLQGDEEGYRKVLQDANIEDIVKLHNMIGDYILTYNKANRYKALKNALDRLEKVQNSSDRLEVDTALQKVAEELSVETLVNAAKDPNALMVFEYALNLTLKDHQVKGVRDMIESLNKNRSVLLQRIQGGGKSLVFGHIMALLKADGYHLSIHVPATSQYQTSVYDMQARSKQLFNQRERTLVFDDEPLKFTPEYLTWMKEMLKETIVNREYITITNESLRAMRCKYLRTRFEIFKSPAGANVAEMEKSNQILKEILYMLRTRGVITFDETHKALDPFKELNMPYGQPAKPNLDENILLSEIVRMAFFAKDDSIVQKPLLDIQHTAQQTPEQYTMMKTKIIEGLLKRESWNQPGIKEYLSGTTDDVPVFLDNERNKDLARLVVLARQMLAGNWLKDRLNYNVNEHHGIPKTGFPLVSIPFVANMKPAIGSEFSGRYVMTINTMIAYLANGLNDEQTKELIVLCRRKADAEKKKMAIDIPNCSVKDTLMYRNFSAGVGVDFFRIDTEKQDDIKKIQEGLLSGKAESMEILLDYVINREINSVELYENQVCSNGQNVASMGQAFVAYSGSMDNKNMAPVDSDAHPETGTNGQTIDLLIGRKMEVKLLEEDVSSLLTEMKRTRDKENIHAIIDVGAFFRGMDNEEAAIKICDSLKEINDKLKGVLFFDSMRGNLCFMQRDHSIKPLSGTTPEIIKMETGFNKGELLTYYDQDNITGTDIAQDDDAIGFVTVNERTKIHEILQGVRRLRQLDFDQKVVMTMPKSALNSIQSTLKKTYMNDEAPPIKDLLLYANIKEAKGQKPENMQYCVQKMENIIQQWILDKLQTLGVNSERELFQQCAYLFEKSVAVDLIKEYAHKRGSVEVQTYLGNIRDALLGPLENVLDKLELDFIREDINSFVLNDETIKGLEPKVSVSSSFAPDSGQVSTANHNKETTRLQTKLQVRTSEKLQQVDQKNINTMESQKESRKIKKDDITKECMFSEQEFIGEDFGKAERPVASSSAACWTLKSGLIAEKQIAGSSATVDFPFDDGLLVTSNEAQVEKKKIDLTGDYRKKPLSSLVICDEGPNGAKTWKVVLCSVEDAVNFNELLSNKDAKLPKGRTMWLVRGNASRIAGPSELDIDNNPHLSLLMTQALFFSGDFATLSFQPWKQRLESWVDPMDDNARKKLVRYFESEIIRGQEPEYPSSNLQAYLNKPFNSLVPEPALVQNDDAPKAQVVVPIQPSETAVPPNEVKPIRNPLAVPETVQTATKPVSAPLVPTPPDLKPVVPSSRTTNIPVESQPDKVVLPIKDTPQQIPPKSPAPSAPEKKSSLFRRFLSGIGAFLTAPFRWFARIFTRKP
jgi:hypothetical protein